ncbi:MAG: hypothetical protein IH846_17445, partial [Acidobacteria bacterium]|nr:hypothetical protein [Acidobacteriota bacterium]
MPVAAPALLSLLRRSFTPLAGGTAADHKALQQLVHRAILRPVARPTIKIEHFNPDLLLRRRVSREGDMLEN